MTLIFSANHLINQEIVLEVVRKTVFNVISWIQLKARQAPLALLICFLLAVFLFVLKLCATQFSIHPIFLPGIFTVSGMALYKFLYSVLSSSGPEAQVNRE